MRDHTTATEELTAIRMLMADSQSFLRGTWPHQLVWGLLATMGLAGTWLAANNARYSMIGWVWTSVLAIGWAYSLGTARGRGSDASVRNAASRAFSGIWLSLGVTLTLLGLLTVVAKAVDPQRLPGVIAVVFGAGYFASGVLAEMRWIGGVGVAWWVGGAALLLWDSPHTVLGLAAMTLCLEVGPALVLRRMERSAAAGH